MILLTPKRPAGLLRGCERPYCVRGVLVEYVLVHMQESGCLYAPKGTRSVSSSKDRLINLPNVKGYLSNCSHFQLCTIVSKLDQNIQWMKQIWAKRLRREAAIGSYSDVSSDVRPSVEVGAISLQYGHGQPASGRPAYHQSNGRLQASCCEFHSLYQQATARKGETE